MSKGVATPKQIAACKLRAEILKQATADTADTDAAPARQIWNESTNDPRIR